MPQAVTTLTADRAPLPLLTEALTRKLRQEGRNTGRLDPDADMIELGLIDSQALLDIILEVEEACGVMFDAEGMDFENGVTLRRLAAAFTG